MIYGHSSLERARSMLMDDITEAGDRWRAVTRLTPAQTIEKVINRKQTVAMSGIPAYVWGVLDWEAFDPEEHSSVDYIGDPIRTNGLITVDMDLGNYQRGLWQTDRRGTTRNIRYNVVADEVANSGAMDKFFGGEDSIHSHETLFQGLIKHGLMVHQPFLFRVDADWSTDYFGESDLYWTSELIFSEPREITEEWMDWLLESARFRAEQVARREKRELERQQKYEHERFLNDIARGKGKSKLVLPGAKAHADSVKKKTRPWL